MRIVVVSLTVLFLGFTSQAFAQTEKMNFRDRQAVIINNAPQFLELSNFKFENRFSQSRIRLSTDLNWKNTSDKAIAAFELVVLRYDPFNRPLPGGGRWLVTGHNSGDWAPLMPGQLSGDGLLGYDSEPALTSVAFIRAIRFMDGNVWTFNQGQVESEIRKRLPILKDLGLVNPPLEGPNKQ